MREHHDAGDCVPRRTFVERHADVDRYRKDAPTGRFKDDEALRATKSRIQQTARHATVVGGGDDIPF